MGKLLGIGEESVGIRAIALLIGEKAHVHLIILTIYR